MAKFKQFGLQKTLRSHRVISKMIDIVGKAETIDERSSMAFKVLEAAFSHPHSCSKENVANLINLLKVTKIYLYPSIHLTL